MIRTFNITILLILINFTYAQQTNPSFHDGKVWFKIKDEVDDFLIEEFMKKRSLNKKRL